MSSLGTYILNTLLLLYCTPLQQESTAEESTSYPNNCSQSVSHRGETVSTCCVFPFIYLGEQHNSCVTSEGTPWCSTTSNYDADHKKMDCPTIYPDGGGGGEGEAHCHAFPSGLSTLVGGPMETVRRWNLQCQPLSAMTALWDDVHRFTLFSDVKCCDAPVDQNISSVINVSMGVDGRHDSELKLKAPCPDNYVITGLHARKEGFKMTRTFGDIDAVKCSLLLEHRLDYNFCTTVDLPDSTGGTRDPTARWKTECPSEHFMSALYYDSNFNGVKKIKCCPSRAVAISQRICTFENRECSLWGSLHQQDGKWKLQNGTTLGNVDHTTGKITGHVIRMTSNTSFLSSVGMMSSKQGRCLSLWYSMKGTSRVDVLGLLHERNADSLIERHLGDVKIRDSTKWRVKQVVLPRNTNYQLVIKGIISPGSIGEIRLDDIQIKPERFCAGVCSTLGPLQGFRSISNGPIILWEAGCRNFSSSPITSVVSGLWDKKGTHFRVLEYMKCCNMPVGGYYKVLLAGKKGGTVSKHERWKAQCQDNHVLTGINSLNKFNGFYQLQCSVLYRSRVDYTDCVVIWGEERNHVGDFTRRHVECPFGMAIIALFDHEGDNDSNTSFVDIDAIKCCMIHTQNCVTQADCHGNADCVTTNTIKKCVCRTGFYGNGKFCRIMILKIPTTESTSITSQYTTIYISRNPSAHKTSLTNGGDYPSHKELDFPTPGLVANQRKERSQSLILILSVFAALLFIMVALVCFVWRVRRAKKARLRVQRSKDQAEMTPFNDLKITCSNDSQVEGQEDDDTALHANNSCQDNDKDKSKRLRSATFRSVEHAYMSEEELDSSPAVREPVYFELDRNVSQKNYSIHRFLALPEPMYGILEPETEGSTEDPGAQFWKPANTEEELYLQLSREIKRDQLEVGTERLGSGAFGHVMLGVWQKTPKCAMQVAVKMLRDSTHLENKIKFLQEAAIMRQFTHKNVIYMYGIVTNSEPVMIVLEYMSQGNLKNYLRQLDSSYGEEILLQEDTKSQFLRMARDIAAGMQYLHSLAFVHRDLAARNILLDSDMMCKIGDFGMSRDLVEGDYYTSHGGRIPVKWTAPEAINYGKYSSASDVWSYGVVLYEIWSLGLKPYENLDNNEVIEAVSRGYRLPPPVHCPNMLYRLMVDCWHPESHNRPRSYQIHYCLCFSHQSVFLDDTLYSKSQPLSAEQPPADTLIYMDLEYVYAEMH